jgi:hypothetical protein
MWCDVSNDVYNLPLFWYLFSIFINSCLLYYISYYIGCIKTAIAISYNKSLHEDFAILSLTMNQKWDF